MKLTLADTLVLPLDAFTQPWAILAMRGAGKTNAASVMAEELFAARRPFVVVDPVGSWYGLRASADGTPGAGLSVPIFGGAHGDVPLEEAGGEVIADFLVDERASSVVDVSDFSENAKHRFLTQFTERLFRRNREPLVVILEEADDYAPQRPGKGPALATLGAMQRLVKRGRFKGLTPIMITQRSAALSKDLLTQIENLVVLRTTSPQDQAAIEAWIVYHGQSKELLESLAGLEDGEAWLWSPHALHTLKRFRFRRRHTFDSGATPTGSGHPRAATLADVDLGALRTRMAATIERAKAEDPKELRRQLADAKREIERLRKAAPAPEVKVETVAVITPREVSELDAMTDRFTQACERLLTMAPTITGQMQVLRDALSRAQQRPTSGAVRLPTSPRSQPTPSPRVASNNGGPTSLPGPDRKLLTALAQHGARTRRALALLTRYAHTGGAFCNPLGRLRSAGYIEGRDVLTITDAGLAALGSWEPLPTGAALLEHWLASLPGPDAKLLRAVATAFPDPISVDHLAEVTGYARGGGAFLNPLGRLRTLGLIEGRAVVKASEELFD